MFIYILGQAQVCYTYQRQSSSKMRPTNPIITYHSPRSRGRNFLVRHKVEFLYNVIAIFLSLLTLQSFISKQNSISATSINYGISQQPITDINQLMPKLCQEQSVICEGSFCIPGVKRCVCDLRMPVKFGRFCLRQVDVETKCFVTSQCNHTIKDAVCIDTNSNSVLNAESSMFKLDQWQQLNELRQLSQQSATSKDFSKPMLTSTVSQSTPQPMFLLESIVDSPSFEARDVIISNARTSPYEINYNTPELLSQNHTRRRLNQQQQSTSSEDSFRMLMSSTEGPNGGDRSRSRSQLNRQDSKNDKLQSELQSSPTVSAKSALTPTSTTSASSTREPEDLTMRPSDEVTTRARIELTPPSSDKYEAGRRMDYGGHTISTTTASSSLDVLSRRKTIVKTPNWPPGVCSCPFGFMFDSMLRKCLALSLVDSHCLAESDCQKIPRTHCSSESKKCECDEPLVWNQSDLSCQKPKPSTVSPDTSQTHKKDQALVDSMLTPLLMAKLLPDQTVLLLIFVIIIIIGTLVILSMTVKCFSSSSSALISPKTKKKRSANNGSNNLPPRSPYATLRRPDHKPSSQLSNFTQATRGRILNYDFEQENPMGDLRATDALSPDSGQNSRVKGASETSTSQTLGRPKKQKTETPLKVESATMGRNYKPRTESDDQVDSLVELNDNISVSQLESENKSDNSILTIPGPPPTQAPPYMMATSAMKGQRSAIAAAAAAVANKRIQMAQKRNIESQTSGRQVNGNGNPVFL